MTIKEIRERTGLTQAQFAERYHLKLSTVQSWEAEADTRRRPCPEYILDYLGHITGIKIVESWERPSRSE